MLSGGTEKELGAARTDCRPEPIMVAKPFAQATSKCGIKQPDTWNFPRGACFQNMGLVCTTRRFGFWKFFAR